MLKHHADIATNCLNLANIVSDFGTLNHDLSLLVLFKAINTPDQRRFA